MSIWGQFEILGSMYQFWGQFEILRSIWYFGVNLSILRSMYQFWGQYDILGSIYQFWGQFEILGSIWDFWGKMIISWARKNMLGSMFVGICWGVCSWARVLGSTWACAGESHMNKLRFSFFIPGNSIRSVKKTFISCKKIKILVF
jgi:hypothetical protein